MEFLKGIFSKKQSEGAGKSPEQKDWEQREGMALTIAMNRFAESFHKAFIGGPSGISMRFQTFSLTEKDFAFLEKTLPKEEAQFSPLFRGFSKM